MERVAPHNLEAEQSVVAAALVDADALDVLAGMLSPEDFYLQAHRVIFGAVVEMFRANRPVDLVTLTNHLATTDRLESAGGMAGISALVGRISTTANAAHWAGIVREKAVLRHTITHCAAAIEQAYGEPDDPKGLVSDLQGRLEDLVLVRDRGGLVPIVSPYLEFFDWMWEHRERPTFAGLTTGWGSIDGLVMGMEPGDLIYLAARTSMGKTAFALNLLHNLCFRDNHVAALFSCEMRKEKIVRRLTGIESEVSLDNLINCNLTDAEWRALVPTGEEFRRARLYISDSRKLTVPDIRAACRRLRREQGKLELVVIDQLNFLRNHGYGWQKLNKNDQLGEISRDLKVLAEELECPVICLHQLNRSLTSREDPTPMLSDLRSSGELEQDADQVWFLHRPGKFKKDYPRPNEVQFILGKGRDRKVTNVRPASLVFVEGKGRFEETVF